MRQSIAEKFVNMFLRLFKNLEIYPKEHSLISGALDEICDSVHKADDIDGKFHLNMKGGYLYLNGHKLDVNVENYHFFRRFMSILREKEIGELEVISSLLKKEEIYKFVKLLIKEDARGDGIVCLLITERLNSIIVKPLPEGYEEEGIKAKAQKLYFQTIALIRHYFTQITKETVSLVKLKAASSYLAELLRESEDVLLGLTIIKNYDDYTYNHCLNVAILSMALGLRIGLPKKILVELGTGALIHDIGKVKIPLEILNKPGGLTDKEWEIVKRHPLEGMVLVLKRWGFSKETARLLPPVVEHHLGLNFSGYPEFMRDKKPSLLSRLIHIADFYDAVTTPRVYNPTPFSPSDAVEYLIKYAGARFDPILVRLFVNMMGFYPVGTMVKLDCGDWGMVVKAPKDHETLDRPVVKVLMAPDGSPLPPRIIDLGDNSMSIVKAVSPWELGINPADYALD